MTDTEALRAQFEKLLSDSGRACRYEGDGQYAFPHDLAWLWFQVGHAAAKAENTAAVAAERERAAQFCDRRQAELLALVPGARRSNVVRMHEACANTAAVLAQAIRAGVKEPDGDPTL